MIIWQPRALSQLQINSQLVASRAKCRHETLKEGSHSSMPEALKLKEAGPPKLIYYSVLLLLMTAKHCI